MIVYKQWLKLSFFSIFSIIFSISIFNYKVDSLGIFGNIDYLEKAAKILTKGQMIAGLKNYNDRLFEKFVIENLRNKNDVIAVGSSRTMQLRKHYFFNNDINFYNHSVSGASLEDYISIVGMYESINDYIPPTIIMGIDPWIFNKYNDQLRWKILSTYYTYEIDKIYNKQQKKGRYINTTKWKQLLSYEYTISNIKFIISNYNNKQVFYITNSIEIDDSIKEIDGSIHHPYEKRYPDFDKVRKIATAYTKGSLYSLEKFNSLSNIKLFEDFISYLQSKNIKIIFFLPPYNPISYDIFIKNKKYKNVSIVETYLKYFASTHNITLYGSYNPHKYKFTNDCFFDGMHGLDETYKKIFKGKNFEK